MVQGETIPLVCPKCREVTERPLRWVQENVFFTCTGCGAPVLIDKDAATKHLAARALDRR